MTVHHNGTTGNVKDMTTTPDAFVTHIGQFPSTHHQSFYTQTC